MRRVVLALAAAVTMAALAGCAGGASKKAEAARPVPVEIVPTDLTELGLTLQPNTDKETADAFSTAGPLSLVGEGKVWEVRAADRLVGALELATLKVRVNPGKVEDRNAILGQILPGANERIEVQGQPVWTAKGGGSNRAVFVFFGAHILGVLQLKGKGLDIEKISSGLIGRVSSQPLWDALPPESFDEAPRKR